MPRTSSVTIRSSQNRLLALLGPAFVAAIAYVDPGNVAANMSAGAEYGYLLLWVLVLANAMAAIVQYLSAKLGLVTGESLPSLLGKRLSTTSRRLYWVQAELVAAATDLAEVIGGALALYILFGIPLLPGGILVGILSILILMLQGRRQRQFEGVMIFMLIVITVGFVGGLLFVNINPSELVAGLVPRFADVQSLLLATSMLGATIMPHAIYLHSSLSRDRHGASIAASGDDPRLIKRLLKASKIDVFLALILAGGVNIAMLILAAASLQGVDGTDTIDGAANVISTHLGAGVGIVFGIGLLASGLASTSVGAYAGAEIMAGLLRVRIPLLVRRVVTLLPALIILGIGIDPTWSLIISQVVLSFGLPFAIIPLVALTGKSELMGGFVNRLPLRIAGIAIAVAIVVLNGALIVLELSGMA
ncbi:Nramp family divalent metal transporter [Leucobacter sp. cx-328]|uniref:Nramp family divalent metal transporter n=1 Tax=unclassified Leucobacter TaxID=2621730 RepID=UPI00165DAC18|nr:MULTISPECIES: Nramp family divalent metal transporter [unclassified Leucobacter]MBC9944401.1 Nramp family divalent metal transporter [Leucobacter sp. cx-328]